MTSSLSCLEKSNERQAAVEKNRVAVPHDEIDEEPLVESSTGSARSIQGASSAGEQVPVEAQNLMLEYLNVPACPEEFHEFLEETSLERLVFWKLRGLFEKVEDMENVLEVVLTHVERPLFALALQKTKGNQSKAAKVLGCNRNTLHRKLKALSIQPMELRRAIKDREKIKSRRKSSEISEER
jgi:DNA-binding protein Fis